MSSVRTSPTGVKQYVAETMRKAAAAPRFQETTLGRWFWKTFYGCASLKLAVSLLSLFTTCLILATLLEAWYSARIAQELVYQTWWFTGLLCLLAVNVLCAALKKIPWKRHQIGFLITHLGLLVLVFGGLLTNLQGIEGNVVLLDSANPDIQQAFRLGNRSDYMQLAHQQQIEVYRMPKDEELREQFEQVMSAGVEMPESLRAKLGKRQWQFRITPGSFAWRDDEHHKAELTGLLKVLKTMANPFPSYSQSLGDDVKLRVENFYPHTERWPVAPAEPNDKRNFPALQVKLTTPMAPRPVKKWVTPLPEMERDPSPLLVEMFVLPDTVLLDEFLNPPTPKEMGSGELVLAIGEKVKIIRLKLDDLKIGETIPLPGTDLTFKLVKRGQLTELMGHNHHGGMGGHGHGQGHGQGQNQDMPKSEYPSLRFNLMGPSCEGTYIACARKPHGMAYMAKPGSPPVSAWYHHPDFRWGQKDKMGALQFLYGTDGKLYYRVYGKDGLKAPGKVLDGFDEETVHELPFQPMEMKLQVTAWLPEAVKAEHIKPRSIRPGAEPTERLEPALRCTLEADGEKQEFWARMGRSAIQVDLGKETYLVRYRGDAVRLPFDLTLKNARQINDPGSSRAAAFESDVVLTSGDVKKEYTVSMNNTLDHNGYKIYQTNYKPMFYPQTDQMVLDEKGNLVSLSGFTVSDDPGLFCKYLGSGLLVLGIAVMFWMRAYFFKPRGAKPVVAI